MTPCNIGPGSRTQNPELLPARSVTARNVQPISGGFEKYPNSRFCPQNQYWASSTKRSILLNHSAIIRKPVMAAIQNTARHSHRGSRVECDGCCSSVPGIAGDGDCSAENRGILSCGLLGGGILLSLAED